PLGRADDAPRRLGLPLVGAGAAGQGRVTSPEVLERLDPARIARRQSAADSDDDVLDLLPRGRGLAAASRRAYSRRPFDHHAPKDDPGAFVRGISPLVRRLAGLLPREGCVLEAGSGAGHATAWLQGEGVPVLALDQSVESLR